MKKVNLHIHLALLFSFILLPAISFSDDSTSDSLLSTYKNTTNDSIKVYALREIVNYWKTSDCDSTMYYSKRLIPEAEKIKYHKFVYKGYYW
ncbi:MAG: hypothetical protein P9L91_00155, partial [Candidatus Zophobacter franzmannii]|nr:hypothetical protein [Candidatus Zophobacter franzmannii]